ncbi:MAG: class I adenylate-forming enzyme family protein [Mesorhizobium sp.]
MTDQDESLRIGDYLDRHARAFPERIALRDERTELSYADLAAAVEHCARGLLASGIRQGDRIAVLSPQRTDAFVTFLAAARLGVLWLGLNPRYQMRELEYLVGDARPKLLFTVGHFEGRDFAGDAGQLARQFGIDRIVMLDDLATGWFDPGLVSDAEFNRAVIAVPSTSDALLVYTSGSSGQPKGVLLPQRSLLARSRTQNREFATSDYPRLINPLPINHIGGMHFLSLFTFVGGGTLTLAERFRADQYIAALVGREINVLIMLPTMLQIMINTDGFDPALLDELEWFVFSGAAMPRELVDMLYEAKCQVGLTYGMTETCGSVTYAKKSDSPREVLTRTIGRARPDGEVRIGRDDGSLCDVGENGEIQIKARHAMAGYFNRPEATRDAYTQDGWLRTGDTAILRADGNIEFVGRRSEMFKSGGYNVYPREIELALEELDAIEMSAVIGVPDNLYGEVGWAYVVPRPGGRLDSDELKTWCQQRLANYKIPKRFIVVDQLPMLPVGKADKVRLKAEARAELGAA